MISDIIYYLAALVAIIFIFAPHEYAHAYVAYKCGDPTAKMRGRMSLNPLRHLDPYGFVLCVLTGFGWAKPVPVNPYNFHNYRRGMFLTSIAGVVVNYIIAFISFALYLLILQFFPSGTGYGVYVKYFLWMTFWLIYSYSLSVFVFNLLPLYPLDGFRIVESLTREVNPVHRFLKNYGRYILIALVVESFLCSVIERYTVLYYAKYFDILGYVHWFATEILGYPIKLVWYAVFGYGLPTLGWY